MSQDQDAQLVRMVNQIAANLSHGREATSAVAAIRTHLEKFWARPMKRRVVAQLAQEDSDLTPLARRAVAQLAQRLTETPT
ncbi:hypothetical protein EQG41_03755 [Billgrantia azerbaijanica]|nr:hypothetical protein EQG41_03755 [Halomonas azerbaijanica]